MRKVLAVLALIALAWPAAADQNDPRLDGLFEQLKGAEDATEASVYDAEIWKIWLQHRDKRTQEATLIGMSFMSRGQARLADLAFSEAIGRHPDFAEAWNKRATLRFLTGDLEGSIKDCMRVLRLEPRHYGALSGLGMIAMEQENWKQAIEWFERALDVNPFMSSVEQNLKNARKKIEGERI